MTASPKPQPGLATATAWGRGLAGSTSISATGRCRSRRPLWRALWCTWECAPTTALQCLGQTALTG